MGGRVPSRAGATALDARRPNGATSSSGIARRSSRGCSPPTRRRISTKRSSTACSVRSTGARRCSSCGCTISITSASSRRSPPRSGDEGLPPVKLGVTLRLANDNWHDAAAYAVEAEKLGVDYVWSAEAWGHDAVTPLAFVAARTSRVKLGTAIMQVGTRTPALVAMTAMSLDAMSDGRFLLGLGVSGPQVIEGWHGIPFRQPLPRMRETTAIGRRAVRGERVPYEGAVYRLP